jgi:uncharacterized membrane protein YdfJ with MMPL/SSD domain
VNTHATEEDTVGFAVRAGRWSARHPWRAILGWLAFVAIATVIGGQVGMKNLADEDTANGESAKAEKAYAGADFPDKADEQILIQGRGDTKVGDPAFTAAVNDVVQRFNGVRNVEEVESPLAKGNEGQLSRDGRSAMVTFSIPGDDEATKDRVDATLAATAAAQKAHPDLRIEQFGGASADKALSEAFDEDFQRAEIFSLPITLIILIVAFGALLAAIIPVVLAMTAVVATLGLLAPLTQVFPVEESISSVVLLIGLAVGVDYSLFYLRREREERENGRSKEASLIAAAATSGRAVLVSGFTVMVAMAGMFFAGNAVFTSFAWGTILVVAVAMIGSVTVLPALLAKLGDKVMWGKVPFLAKRRERNHESSRVWGWILDRVLRRPVIAIVLSAGLLLALSVPALSLKTINPGLAGLPHDLAIMQTYDRIQAAFPGGPQPAVVVVEAQDVTAAPIRRGIEDLERAALATNQMSGPVDVTVSPNREVALVSIPLAGNGTDDRSETALATLRDRVMPATIDRVSGAEANVTGLTAGSKDFNDTMKSNLPFVFAFVLGVAFLLLLVTFRSVVVPLKAIVLNLLSVGAAYGILKLVFQDGRLEGVLNYESLGGVTSWLPLFLFVILFGLSMDYHVFIISRIREAVDRGMSTEQAVSHGIKATAGVVTSAAVVMVAVFAIFATLSSIEFKMMGVGLAAAILIDATIVRGVLLPATMKLLGEANWYLPKRLHWLPKVRHEAAPEPAGA